MITSVDQRYELESVDLILNHKNVCFSLIRQPKSHTCGGFWKKNNTTWERRKKQIHCVSEWRHYEARLIFSPSSSVTLVSCLLLVVGKLKENNMMFQNVFFKNPSFKSSVRNQSNLILLARLHGYQLGRKEKKHNISIPGANATTNILQGIDKEEPAEIKIWGRTDELPLSQFRIGLF